MPYRHTIGGRVAAIDHKREAKTSAANAIAVKDCAVLGAGRALTDGHFRLDSGKKTSAAIFLCLFEIFFASFFACRHT